MRVHITIHTDNAVFEGAAGQEVACILRKIADQITDWPGANEFTIGLRDANGNKVGECTAVEG
jgi:hypothetical protein